MTLMWLRHLSVCVGNANNGDCFGSQPVSLSKILDVTLNLLALQVRLKDA